MKKILLLVVLLVLVSCSQPNLSTINNTQTPTAKREINKASDEAIAFIRPGVTPIMGFIGDSRAYGGFNWDYFSNYILNFSLAGGMTDQALNHIGQVIEGGAKYIFIFCGINDIHRNIKDFQSDLTRMSIACYLNNVKFVILDQTYCRENLFSYIAGTGSPYFTYSQGVIMDQNWVVYKLIMQNIPLAEYLPVNYDQSDFIDFAHLNYSGYCKVAEAIHARFPDCVLAGQ